MFIAAAGGAIVVGAIAYDDHSNHSNHSKHNQYGDAALVQQINYQQSLVDEKEEEIDDYRQEMQEELNERIYELQQETGYDSLDIDDYEELLDAVKREMKEELKASIAAEKAELERIDQMIARINEIEMNSGGAE